MVNSLAEKRRNLEVSLNDCVKVLVNFMRNIKVSFSGKQGKRMKGENDLNKLTKANDLMSDKCGKYERERQQNSKPLKV